MLRIDHYGCQAFGADRLDQIEGVLRIAVQIDKDDVVIVSYLPREIAEVGRIGGEFLNMAAVAFPQRTRSRIAASFVRTDNGNGQNACADKGIEVLDSGRHDGKDLLSCISLCRFRCDRPKVRLSS